MTLREKQSAFARAIAGLVLWITAEGKARGERWEVTLGEGSVAEKRRVRTGAGPVVAMDCEHMAGSLHYLRLAQDLNLFVSGSLVADGAHPAWAVIGEQWKAMHSLCAWGGDFKSVDSNHFSFRHGGKA